MIAFNFACHTTLPGALWNNFFNKVDCSHLYWRGGGLEPPPFASWTGLLTFPSGSHLEDQYKQLVGDGGGLAPKHSVPTIPWGEGG